MHPPSKKQHLLYPPTNIEPYIYLTPTNSPTTVPWGVSWQLWAMTICVHVHVFASVCLCPVCAYPGREPGTQKECVGQRYTDRELVCVRYALTEWDGQKEADSGVGRHTNAGGEAGTDATPSELAPGTYYCAVQTMHEIECQKARKPGYVMRSGTDKG